MTPDQKYKVTIAETKLQRNYTESQGEVAYTDAELDTTPHTRWGDVPVKFKIAKGDIIVNSWITENGFIKTTRKSADCLLTVGDKSENGAFVVGNHKNYWLKKYEA